MKAAIVYISNHGTTEKVANLIAEKLNTKMVQVLNITENKKVSISEFDLIILGGSVHAGRLQGKMRKFIKDNMLDLLQKKVGIFLCCMNEPEEKSEFNNAFPELLRNHSEYNAIVGGEFNFERMNFFERLIVRKVSGINNSISKLRFEEIEKLTEAINNNILNKEAFKN